MCGCYKLRQDIRTGSRGSPEEGDPLTCAEASSDEQLPGEEVQVSAPGNVRSQQGMLCCVCWARKEAFQYMDKKFTGYITDHSLFAEVRHPP